VSTSRVILYCVTVNTRMHICMMNNTKLEDRAVNLLLDSPFCCCCYTHKQLNGLENVFVVLVFTEYIML
jgi:hypothetical protein